MCIFANDFAHTLTTHMRSLLRKRRVDFATSKRIVDKHIKRRGSKHCQKESIFQISFKHTIQKLNLQKVTFSQGLLNIHSVTNVLNSPQTTLRNTSNQYLASLFVSIGELAEGAGGCSPLTPPPLIFGNIIYGQ